jgi:hypothetical protein
MRLNLGSGPDAVDGWVNIDRSPNLILERFPAVRKSLKALGVIDDVHMRAWSTEIKRLDIRKLPYASGSVTAIYSSHTLEHLYFEDARTVLKECFRLLRAGGVLRLALPDAEYHARQLLDGCARGEHGAGLRYNVALLAHPTSRPGLIRSLVGAAGGHVHRWQPTSGLVIDMLSEAGFRDMTRREFREGLLEGLDVLETRPESFFIEAVR